MNANIHNTVTSIGLPNVGVTTIGLTSNGMTNIGLTSVGMTNIGLSGVGMTTADALDFPSLTAVDAISNGQTSDLYSTSANINYGAFIEFAGKK